MNAVVFDVDGTLLQSADVDEALYCKAVEDILGDVRFRDDLAEYRYVTDSGILEQVFEDNGVVECSRKAAQIRQRFYDLLDRHIATYGPFAEVAGARNLVRRLRQSDTYAVAIATGGWRATAELKLRTAGFELSDIPLATCDDAIDRIDIMRIALAALGDTFETVLYFGDAAWDRRACERLGWGFRAVGSRLAGLLSYEGVEV